MHTSLVALTAGLVATASAFDCHGPYFSFYNRGGSVLSYQRLDPALDPGQQSSHLHSFDGGNALASSMSFATTQESTCTTARIKPDKSLYWRPTLYWNGNNTGFYRVPEMYSKVYYKFGDSGNVKANVSEFPENFRMMAGNPFLRAEDTTENAGPGVSWSCKGSNGNSDAQGFPTGFTSCPGGFATQITFPACWNGNDLNPSSPSAHMSYPTAGGLGLDACPDGFKVARFPSIFIEFWWDVSSFDNQYSSNSNPWALSMGDPTGHGFHADFLNGWETGVLAKATADDGYCNCGCGCGEDEMKTCFGDANVNNDDDDTFKSCAATPDYPGEDGERVDKLPGCNPIQSGPATATQASGAGCTASAIASAVSSIASAVNTTVNSALSSVMPSISVSLPNKGAGSASYDFATPTTTLVTSASNTNPVFDNVATHSSFASEALVNGNGGSSTLLSAATTMAPLAGEGGCKAPVYITITPTIYVTAGAEGSFAGNSTDCPSTVYTTVTNKLTVTVPAASASAHGQYGVDSY